MRNNSIVATFAHPLNSFGTAVPGSAEVARLAKDGASASKGFHSLYLAVKGFTGFFGNLLPPSGVNSYRQKLSEL
jgi:hypothetical protein